MNGTGRTISFAEFNAKQLTPGRKRTRACTDSEVTDLTAKRSALGPAIAEPVQTRRLAKPERVAVGGKTAPSERTSVRMHTAIPAVPKSAAVTAQGTASFMRTTASSRSAVRTRGAPAGNATLAASASGSLLFAAGPSILDEPVSSLLDASSGADAIPSMSAPLVPLAPDGAWASVLQVVQQAGGPPDFKYRVLSTPIGARTPRVPRVDPALLAAMSLPAFAVEAGAQAVADGAAGAAPAPARAGVSDVAQKENERSKSAEKVPSEASDALATLPLLENAAPQPPHDMLSILAPAPRLAPCVDAIGGESDAIMGEVERGSSAEEHARSACANDDPADHLARQSGARAQKATDEEEEEAPKAMEEAAEAKSAAAPPATSAAGLAGSVSPRSQVPATASKSNQLARTPTLPCAAATATGCGEQEQTQPPRQPYGQRDVALAVRTVSTEQPSSAPPPFGAAAPPRKAATPRQPPAHVASTPVPAAGAARAERTPRSGGASRTAVGAVHRASAPPAATPTDMAAALPSRALASKRASHPAPAASSAFSAAAATVAGGAGGGSLAAEKLASGASLPELLACLADMDADRWQRRADALIALRLQLERGKLELPPSSAALPKLAKAVGVQINDLRSQIVKEACALVRSYCAQVGSALPAPICDGWISALLCNTYVTIKIIASSSRDALHELVKLTRCACSVPLLCKLVCTDKHAAARRTAAELLLELVRACAADELRPTAGAIEDAVCSALADADAGTRPIAGKLFWAYGSRFGERQPALEAKLDSAQQKIVTRAR